MLRPSSRLQVQFLFQMLTIMSLYSLQSSLFFPQWRCLFFHLTVFHWVAIPSSSLDDVGWGAALNVTGVDPCSVLRWCIFIWRVFTRCLTLTVVFFRCSLVAWSQFQCHQSGCVQAGTLDENSWSQAIALSWWLILPWQVAFKSLRNFLNCLQLGYPKGKEGEYPPPQIMFLSLFYVSGEITIISRNLL